MKKLLYIDIMEMVMEAYTEEHIKAYTQTVAENSIQEHGYPRLTANLGILIAHGRKKGYKDLFCKMMDLCCREIPVSREKNGHNAGNDFSVKEIVLCLLEIEKSGVYNKNVTDVWRKELSNINPYSTYSAIASVPPKPINNWAAFSAASEQVRKYAGIGNESAFIDNQIKSQLFSFDENGMYRDPNEPMVYDFVTRLQLASALYFGFDGESRSTLEEELLKSADITLDMQSVTGEIPFGGRSAQFLHNEAFYAALCEFYAVAFKNRGDMEKAGQFKSAARIAVESIIPWLKEDSVRHVKNNYESNSGYGCEEYAYFDKYMITTGSWLYLAYAMADDDIKEVECPAMSQNGIFETSNHFHKVMCRFGDYFVQYDTNADTHYDACGLGRIHKRGAPSAICLSVPFSENPLYKIDISNPSPFSICAGIQNDYTCLPQTKYRLIKKSITDTFVRVEFECITKSGQIIKQECFLSDKGVELITCGNGEVEILFPVFKFDGLNSTKISVTQNNVVVSYKSFKCTYSTDGIITNKNTVYANRNGHYNAYSAKGKNKVSLKIKINNADLQY